MVTDLPSPHSTLSSLTVLRKRLDRSRLANHIKSEEEDLEQRDKLTSLAERIKKAQKMNHKQENKEDVLESRPRPVKLSVVR